MGSKQVALHYLAKQSACYFIHYNLIKNIKLCTTTWKFKLIWLWPQNSISCWFAFKRSLCLISHLPCVNNKNLNVKSIRTRGNSRLQSAEIQQSNLMSTETSWCLVCMAKLYNTKLFQNINNMWRRHEVNRKINWPWFSKELKKRV